MYTAQWTAEKGWDKGALQPYGPITVMPSAQVLNYGQAIFEGMKAQYSAKGRVVVFRPDQNAARFKAGAARMSMPAVPEDQFVEAVKAVVRANVDYVSGPVRTGLGAWAAGMVQSRRGAAAVPSARCG
jgi:branched-chain amino acid aminotransferase